MNIPSKTRKYWQKYKSYILFATLILIMGLITYYRFEIQLNIGPAWDTYDFLANAAEFSGKSIGYTSLERPPLLPFLTSIIFRFTGLYTDAIFIIDGLMFIFGCMGIYLLFKTRFGPITSFLGALIFVTAPIVISSVCTGFSDISSVSISIWAIYFTILAVQRNSKFFYISFPLLTLAFLTRYSAALIVLPIFLYLLINHEKIKHYKDLFIGIILAFLPIIPIILFFYSKFHNPLYPFETFFGSSEGTLLTQHFAYNPDQLFFIKNMPFYMGNESIAVFLIIILGFLIFISRRIKKISLYFKSTLTIISANKLKLVILLLTLFISILTFGKVHYILSELIFFIFCISFYMLLKDMRFGNLDLDLLFLSWFFTYLIFNSTFLVKVDRYFLSMTPAVVYFLIRGFQFTTDQLGLKIRNLNLSNYILTLILIIMMLISIISYLPGIYNENHDFKVINEEVIAASNWLVNYDSNHKNKIIYSDYAQYFAWYLHQDVGQMPAFRENQTIYVWSKDQNFNMEDNIQFNRELELNHADYYLCVYQGLNLTNYKPLQKFGSIIIYKRIK